MRTGEIGYATIWDGNKYVQCRRLPNRDLRCEASGTVLQPSLKSVLTAERLSSLKALGWTLNDSFGNHVRDFPADMTTMQIAEHVQQTLARAYDAKVENLDVKTAWVADIPCPPRNGFSQNLAGLINDAPSMWATSLRTCAYAPTEDAPELVRSAAALIDIYGARTAAEIQRLRINRTRSIYVVFSAGIGYIQCAPDAALPAIYCEAQSAESWAALRAVLTPERVSILRNAGFADPGRAPNHWKNYPLDRFSDAAIAGELLTILHDVYGYAGATKLEIETERPTRR